jgi:hypothetical protein
VFERVCSSLSQHRDHHGARSINLSLDTLAVSGRGWLQEREQVSEVLLHCSMDAFAGLRFVKKFHTQGHPARPKCRGPWWLRQTGQQNGRMVGSDTTHISGVMRHDLTQSRVR